jgi:Anti-sigma-K factor rskA/Putative zinc-finger
MTAHDWFIEHRTEFAARTLDADEEATFRAHLERCDECRAEVERLEHDLAWLPMGASPVVPRPGLRREIVQYALGSASSRRRAWAVPVGVAAALACLAIGWYAGNRRAAAAAEELASSKQRLVALEDTLSVMRQAARVLQAKIELDGRQGGLVIFADPKTHRWNVVIHGLPPAPPNNRYQFWFHCAEGMVPGAEVRVDPARPVMFTTGMPERGCQTVMGAALTLEPIGPAEGPPRGKELAHPML